MLIFYTTAGCHLCEQAEQLLLYATAAKPLVRQTIDIAEHEDLVLRYGVRIPVLQRTDTGEELGWPFNAAELVSFLNHS